MKILTKLSFAISLAFSIVCQAQPTFTAVESDSSGNVWSALSFTNLGNVFDGSGAGLTNSTPLAALGPYSLPGSNAVAAMIVALAQGGGGSATNAVTQLVPTNAPLPSVSGSTIGGIPTNYATPAVVSSIIGGSNYLAAIPAASTNQFAVTNDSRSLSLSSSANIFNAASYRIANGSFFETNIAPFYVIGDAADVANGEVMAIDVANGRILTGTESAGNVFTTNTILDDGAGNARFKSVAGNGNALTNLNAANVFGYLTNVQYFAGSTTNYTDANGNLVLSNTTTHAYSIKNPSSMDATNSGNLTVGGTLNAGTVIGGNLGNIVGLSSNTIIGEAGAAIAGSNYLVGVTAGGGSTNFTGVNSAGVQVTVPWSALPSGGGGGSATNAVVSVTTNGVMAASGITNLDIDATGNATVTVTNLGGTAHITIGATGGGGGTANTAQTNSSSFFTSPIGLTNTLVGAQLYPVSAPVQLSDLNQRYGWRIAQGGYYDFMVQNVGDFVAAAVANPALTNLYVYTYGMTTNAMAQATGSLIYFRWGTNTLGAGGANQPSFTLVSSNNITLNSNSGTNDYFSRTPFQFPISMMTNLDYLEALVGSNLSTSGTNLYLLNVNIKNQ